MQVVSNPADCTPQPMSAEKSATNGKQMEKTQSSNSRKFSAFILLKPFLLKPADALGRQISGQFIHWRQKAPPGANSC